MSSSPLPSPPHFLIIGGGIAGVTCAETLHVLRPDSKISLISATTLVKSVSNLRQVGKLLQEFDVEEKSATELERRIRIAEDITGDLVGDSHVKSILASILDPTTRAHTSAYQGVGTS